MVSQCRWQCSRSTSWPSRVETNGDTEIALSWSLWHKYKNMSRDYRSIRLLYGLQFDELEAIPQKAGFIPGSFPNPHSAKQRKRKCHTCTRSHITEKVKSPVQVTHMSLDWWKKQEFPKETSQTAHADSKPEILHRVAQFISFLSLQGATIQSTKPTSK